jgi:hypothetical protein
MASGIIPFDLKREQTAQLIPDRPLAAVKSGLAVTVLGKTELKAGLRDVGEDLGLPSLPNGAFRLVCSPGQPSDAVRQLQLLIQECAPA